MYETLKMMRQIVTGKEGNKSEIELIKEYKETLNPSILAYFYTNNFGLILETSNLYKYIETEDKASFCLQELDKALITYKLKNNNLFMTYFIQCYKNRLRMETQQIMTDKRKVILYTEDYKGSTNEIINKANNEIENIDMILDEYNLTNTEKKQCLLLNAGFKIKEIASMLNLSVSTIYSRNIKIKEKILNLI